MHVFFSVPDNPTYGSHCRNTLRAAYPTGESTEDGSGYVVEEAKNNCGDKDEKKVSFMTIIQLYQEFCNTDKTEPTGNVVAIYYRQNGTKILALGRSYPRPFQSENTPIEANQEVSGWPLGDDLDRHLEAYCLPATREQARKIHPYLFAFFLEAELQMYRETDNEGKYPFLPRDAHFQLKASV